MKRIEQNSRFPVIDAGAASCSAEVVRFLNMLFCG
jgi:hypothetical protein